MDATAKSQHVSKCTLGRGLAAERESPVSNGRNLAQQVAREQLPLSKSDVLKKWRSAFFLER